MNEPLLNFEGYLGSVESNLEDECLHGKILFIRDLVNYEGKDIPELKAAFRDAVENYLKQCAELNVDPDKTFSGTFNVRVDPELHRSACVAAVQRGQSLNEFVCNSLRESTSGAKQTVVQNHQHITIEQVSISGERDLFEEATSLWQPGGVSKAHPAPSRKQ